MSCANLKRGKVYIFNMYNFIKEDRYGSDVDVENLQNAFEQMNADIEEPFINFSEHDIKVKMEEIKNSDFTYYDYVAIAYGSHGGENSTAITVNRENIYLIRTFLVPLYKNKTLAKKLKWLITQTCRGTLDMHVEGASSALKMPFHDPNYYLISYSTSEGFLSRRCKVNGSIFIQCLCNQLRAHYHDKDIIAILNDVREMVIGICERDLNTIVQKPSTEDNFGSNFSFSFYNENTEDTSILVNK